MRNVVGLFFLIGGVALGVSGCVGMDSMNPAAEEEGAESSFGTLVVEPGSLDFGFVEPGQVAYDVITLSNVGDLPVALHSIEAVGASSFAIDNAATLPGSIAAGTEVAVSVSFAPSTSSTYDGAIALQTDLVGHEYIEIALTGSGSEEITDSGYSTSDWVSLTLSDDYFDFGQVDLGATGTVSATISNVGSDAVMISNIVFNGSVFGWGGEIALPYILSPGSSKDFTLTFSPTAETVSTGNATFITDDLGAPELPIELRGEGADLCSICAPQISVLTGGDDPYTLGGFVSLLGMKDSKDVSITNTGDEPLRITKIHVINDMLFTDGVFSLESLPSFPIELDPYETTGFTVSYKATSTGLDLELADLDQNVIHISSNDPWDSDYVIALSGMGL